MSNDIFTPESKSIRKLFGEVDAFYEVPTYQRPYSWDDERVDQLWDDIYSAFTDWTTDPTNSEAYFLGSVILIKNGDHFDIVDGQQRLTTLTILFSVIRDLYPQLEGKTSRILHDCIKDKIDEKPRIRFTTSIDKQNEFEQTILNKVDFSGFTEKQKKKKPYLNTATNFKKKLEGVKIEELEKLLNYIFDHVQIITIKCFKQSFAIKLFQVLNARGLDLTASDLIKSYLMSSLPSRDQDKFITEWRYIEGLAKELDEDLDNLLSLYLYFLKANNPKLGLYEELTKEIKGRESNVVIFEIKKFLESYKEVMNLQDKSIYSLRYLKHQIYWKTILASAKFHNRNDIKEIAKVIRDFYYSHWIGGFNTTKIKQTSFNLLQLINKEKADIDKIKNELAKISNENNIPARIKQAISENAYNQAWLKPMLLSLEYSQVDITLNFIPLTSEVHIEHVLPIQYGRYDEWRTMFTDEQAKLYLNLLPNLTLLSGKKNIEASNSPFTEKIEIYNGKGMDGIVAYRTTQWVSDRVKAGKANWNIESLEERLTWYISEINKEFGWNLTNITLESIEDELDDDLEEIDEAKKRTKSNFHKECINTYSKKSSRSYEKVKRNTYKDINNNSLLICKISKEHDKYADPSYWYGLDPGELEVLKKDPNNLLLLGCGSENKLIVFPVTFLESKISQMIRSDERHWHINIYQQDGKLRLGLKDGETLDISSYII